MDGAQPDYESFQSAAAAPFPNMPLNRQAMSSLEGYDTDSLDSFRSLRSSAASSFSAEYPTEFTRSGQAFLRATDYDFREFAHSEYPVMKNWIYPGEQILQKQSIYPDAYSGERHTNVDSHRPIPNRPLRVICAGPSFQIGGVEQHTVSLARFFDPRRVRLVRSLVTNRANFHAPSATRLPFPVSTCSPTELARAAGECDVLLMWGEGFNGRLGKNRPIGVYLAHGESTWTRLGLEGCSEVVDHVIAVSSRVKQSVCRGFPTTTILNGVDTSRLGQSRSREAVREKLNFNAGDFVLGSVGRFTQEKQMHLLIEAISRLPRCFKLLLVGYGPRREELLNLANEMIPGRYAFVTAEDFLGDYYRAMDAFSLVSAHEGFGLVIPEAMLCERPVIATNVGCVPEVIRDRISGLVVEPNPDAIASAARALQHHPRWAQGLAAEGRSFADSHLHASRMARDYEDLLWRLARTHGIA